MRRSVQTTASVLFVWLLCVSPGHAGGQLDGRVFAGMIGPAENPDLQDSLHFSDGHFWSDICTRCGFVPGPYQSEETDGGIRFRGMLQSDSRGRFEYDGLVRDDGTIRVTIQWQRRRWYWTSRREIAFQGAEVTDAAPSLAETRIKMRALDPAENPLCARF